MVRRLFVALMTTALMVLSAVGVQATPTSTLHQQVVASMNVSAQSCGMDVTGEKRSVRTGLRRTPVVVSLCYTDNGPTSTVYAFKLRAEKPLKYGRVAVTVQNPLLTKPVSYRARGGTNNTWHNIEPVTCYGECNVTLKVMFDRIGIFRPGFTTNLVV